MFKALWKPLSANHYFSTVSKKVQFHVHQKLSLLAKWICFSQSSQKQKVSAEYLKPVGSLPSFMNDQRHCWGGGMDKLYSKSAISFSTWKVQRQTNSRFGWTLLISNLTWFLILTQLEQKQFCKQLCQLLLPEAWLSFP